MVARRPRSRRGSGPALGGALRRHVVEALRADMAAYLANGIGWPAVLSEAIEQVESGRRAIVLPRYLPPAERDKGVPGSMGVAVITRGNRVLFSGELCGRAQLLWLGVWGDDYPPAELMAKHGRCCGLDPAEVGG